LSTSGDTSDSKPALSTEAPVDSAAWHYDAGDPATELLFKGWTPGHELKAQTIIDHSEPAGTQADPLAVYTLDVLTFRRWAVGEPGFRGNLSCRTVEFSLSQGLKQIAREDDPLRLPAGQPFAGEMLTPPVHGIPHLRPETTSRHNRFAREKLAIEPCRPRSGGLLL
jgi:hypothetical protein